MTLPCSWTQLVLHESALYAGPDTEGGWQDDNKQSTPLVDHCRKPYFVLTGVYNIFYPMKPYFVPTGGLNLTRELLHEGGGLRGPDLGSVNLEFSQDGAEQRPKRDVRIFTTPYTSYHWPYEDLKGEDARWWGVPTERVLRRIGSVLSDRIYIWR
ncbi:hypothetical protein PCH_Pc18g00230 [Penicillium rubens Wisconsin 54-1255]|uniref:Uncharacterized protein n=1 Tax=Penicillium rubens (strain ATCC 28089 / DSM 1075 / NRRL 1951 / Wisconsin 54-1255) TaxID=500485 RepID=B6HBN8_PENRW|nr:hypothetical protein PCH_Pc18g00230 [Penicillium rubens Wisconsin 54-1255]